LVGNETIIGIHPLEQSFAATLLYRLPSAPTDDLPASTTTRMAVAPDLGSSTVPALNEGSLLPEYASAQNQH
jgi:hypothetical protein